MKTNRLALKAQASAALRAARPGAIPMTLLYLLLTAGLTLLLHLAVEDPLTRMAELTQAGLDPHRSFMLALYATGAFGLFLNVLVLIFGMVVDFGYCQWCLGTTRSGIGEYSDLFGGFALSGRILLLRLTILLYCLMWDIVIFVPALTISIMLLTTFPFGAMPALGVWVGALALFFWRVLHYSMATYCLMDEPALGVFHALGKSRLLMRRRCGEYFVLRLSFIGWHILNGCISGLVGAVILLLIGGGRLLQGDASGVLDAASGLSWVGLVTSLAGWPLSLWLTPYITMTDCCFYDSLRSAQPQQSTHHTDQ